MKYSVMFFLHAAGFTVIAFIVPNGFDSYFAFLAGASTALGIVALADGA